MTKPKRIMRSRAKGWKMPPNTVYVGRPTKWGNPYSDGGKQMQVSKFRIMMQFPDLRKTLGYPSPEEIRRELRGKNLACWCAPDDPCHADILLEIANSDD